MFRRFSRVSSSARIVEKSFKSAARSGPASDRNVPSTQPYADRNPVICGHSSQRVCKVEVKRAKSLSVKHSITAVTVLAAPSITDATASGVVDKFTEPFVRAVDHVGEAGGGADDISAIFRL